MQEHNSITILPKMYKPKPGSLAPGEFWAEILRTSSANGFQSDSLLGGSPC